METNDDFREQIRREQQFAARLRLATERLEEAQRERIWAGSTNSSVRRGPTRSPERRRNRPDRPSRSDLQARLTGELEALRQCREWLERLDRGERVVVNLRPETDPETEYVAFDRPHVLRVLARIIADLDDLAGNPPIVEEEATQREDAEARRVRHRRRLAEPDPPPKRLSVQEERAALWDALGLPPHKRGR